MPIRDAEESDIARIAQLVETSQNAAQGMIHDRTVRLFETEGDISGVISFDASPAAVQIAGLAGDPEHFPTLLHEPIRFGHQEGLPVEMVVPADRRAVTEALDSVGFVRSGDGPGFRGEPTVVYRRTPRR